ncbi:MAG: uspA [Bacillota bacterium]|jgi:nucleotide-binding universal stress UspA family protein|nr:uspA [Bacillota bacterium]
MKKILVPVDGSKTSLKAAESAIILAKQFNSEINFITVVKKPNSDKYSIFGLNVENAFKTNQKEMLKHLIDQETKMLNMIVRNIDSEGLKVNKEIVTGKSVYEEIVKTAKDGNYDLIVMGKRGLSAMDRFFIGSVTQRVLAESPCPVLIIND